MALPDFNSFNIKEKEAFLVAEIKQVLWVEQELKDLEASRWKIDPLYSDYKALKFQDEKTKINSNNASNLTDLTPLPRKFAPKRNKSNLD